MIENPHSLSAVMDLNTQPSPTYSTCHTHLNIRTPPRGHCQLEILTVILSNSVPHRPKSMGIHAQPSGGVGEQSQSTPTHANAVMPPYDTHNRPRAIVKS